MTTSRVGDLDDPDAAANLRSLIADADRVRGEFWETIFLVCTSNAARGPTPTDGATSSDT
jgi:hypothetical protein